VTNSVACQQPVAEPGILVRAVGRFAGAVGLSGFQVTGERMLLFRFPLFFQAFPVFVLGVPMCATGVSEIRIPCRPSATP
jgi:hypothetical protein